MQYIQMHAWLHKCMWTPGHSTHLWPLAGCPVHKLGSIDMMFHDETSLS